MTFAFLRGDETSRAGQRGYLWIAINGIGAWILRSAVRAQFVPAEFEAPASTFAGVAAGVAYPFPETHVDWGNRIGMDRSKDCLNSLKIVVFGYDCSIMRIEGWMMMMEMRIGKRISI